MPAKRILSLWFPRLAVERLLRQQRGLALGPFVTVTDQGNMQVLASLSGEASAAGLSAGQSLRDARAMCPGLLSRPENVVAEAEFLTLLRRWAGKFSPWVGEEAPASLVLDITGCAHLFGGEVALLEVVEGDCRGLGLSVHAGIADTVGAAWGLARYGAGGGDMGDEAGGLSGDAIDQEARATRSRAAKGKRRHWTRGGTVPPVGNRAFTPPRIAPPGQTRSTIAPLPMAALRLPAATLNGLNRLGLRRIEDVLGTPRAGLARRFGRELVQRLDQALGAEPEPVSPARPPMHFAVRLSLPDPIGLEDDILAGLDRLLPELAKRLRARGRGARQVRLELSRTDKTSQAISVGLARASADPARIRPLLAMKIGDVDAGFGIDQLRLIATMHEAATPQQHQGPVGYVKGGPENNLQNRAAEMDDLIGRIGARLGLNALTRLYPAQSHAPEKAAIIMAAAWAEPSCDWGQEAALLARPSRPLLLWPPEPVMIPAHPVLPPAFRWRGRDHGVAARIGPERIAPEWWLAEEAWRTGARDYWEVVTADGARLWLYYAHGGELSAGWFCQGTFG